MTTVKLPVGVSLPEGILAKDLDYPQWSPRKKNYDGVVQQFEIWLIPRFGWVIPTLTIRNPGRRFRTADSTRRTYAIAIKDGQVVRVGMGPHVQFHTTVYVRKSRQSALNKFLVLRTSGEGSANEIRDTISTRRARGSMRRMGQGWF